MNKLSKQIAYEIEQAKAMKKLFKQVIYRAVMDAIYLRKSQHTNSIEQDRAVAWLKGESNRKDLDTICELAGVSSDRIVRVSKELFKDGGFSLKYRLDYKELFYDERKEKELYEERIAIATIDGKMSETYAKILAREQIKELRRHESDRERTRQASAATMHKS